MKYIRTVEIYEQVINCEEIDELKEILDKYSPYYSRWRDYINEIMIKNGLSYGKLGAICGFSKNTIKSWGTANKVPKSREAFFRFGMGLRCNIGEMNYILQRYGKYPKLYAKSLEDAIAIYEITHYPEDESVNAYDEFQKKKEIFIKYVNQKNKRHFLHNSQNATLDMEKVITELDDDEQFIQFIKENEVEFMNSYYKLLDYISAFVKAENMDGSYHSLVKGKELNKGFEKMLSNLRNKGEVPNRDKLIWLGIVLNMSMSEINKMLEYANMEKLCAKDKIECVYMFILANLDVSNPYYQIDHAVLVSKYTENPQIKEQCNNLLEELVGLKNSGEVREDVEYYVKETLKSLEFDEDDEIVKLFLKNNLQKGE
ncbi:MAG: hypothetical protein E7254_10715 [Lachnospiraceae bacterium]|nr:hypothetical protein [Lachnospiraceae bacterium]